MEIQDGVGPRALTIYFRSQEPKDVQRISTFSIWIRYQEDGRTVETSQRVEPSDVNGYLWCKWDNRPKQIFAIGVRKDTMDPRVANGYEQMYLIETEDQPVYSIAPDGLIYGMPASFEQLEVVIHYRSSNQLYLHYCTNFKSWTSLPGESFTNAEGSDGYLRIRVPLQFDEYIAGAAINDGRGWWDNNRGRDYTFFPGEYIIEPSGIVRTGAPEGSKRNA